MLFLNKIWKCAFGIKLIFFFLVMIFLNAENYVFGEQEVSIIVHLDKTVEIKAKDASVETVIKNLQEKTKITFVIYPKVDKTKKININKKFPSIRSSIAAILNDFNYSVIESSKNIQKVLVISSDKKKANLLSNDVIQNSEYKSPVDKMDVKSEKDNVMIIKKSETGMIVKPGKEGGMTVKSGKGETMNIKFEKDQTGKMN